MRRICSLLLSWMAGTAAGETLVLRGGTVWESPTAKALAPASVLIENGRIARVGKFAFPRGATELDCTGQTILAGFWNSHVHFFERKWENAEQLPAAELQRQLEAMTTRYGFTTVFDLGSDGRNTRALRGRIENGEVVGPRIRTTGEVITAYGAMPPANILRALGNQVMANHEVADAEQAASAARAIVAAGADGLKIHLQLPLSEQTMRAAVDEAHRAGKPVFVHPSTKADMLAAARAGADVLAHTTPLSAWDETVVPLLRDKRIAITPTLAMWRFLLRHERASVQEGAVRKAVEQLGAWRAAGGAVLFGNDLGAVEYDPTEEYLLMSRAGMSFREILASLTTTPAARFGATKDFARIATGFIGDLTIVQGDPAKEIQALAQVRYTIRDGRVVFRAR